MTARPGVTATGDDPGDRAFALARTLADDVFFPISLTTSEVGVTCVPGGHPLRQVVARPIISRRGEGGVVPEIPIVGDVLRVEPG